MNEIATQLFAKIYLEKATSDDFVDWAIACLEDGFDSKNLRMLAAAEKPYYSSEIDKRFRQSLKELDLDYPNKEETLLDYAKSFAKKIISAELTPEQGCKKIYQISWELDYPDKLKNWLYLDEGVNPETMEWLVDSTKFYPFSESQKLNEAIISEAKKLVETNFS